MTQTRYVPDIQYKVRGFRSLLDFTIDLHSGLNVLVGPNGSGKTNFLDFLDFIDLCIRTGASNAVSSMGGIAKVFSVEQISNKKLKIDAQINSIAELVSQTRDDVYGYFSFSYQIQIVFSNTESAIYISSEVISINSLCTTASQTTNSKLLGVVSIKRRNAAYDGNLKPKFGKRLARQQSINPFMYDRWYPLNNLRRPSLKSNSDNLHLTIEMGPFDSDESILSVRNRSLAFSAIRKALIRGRPANIIPNIVRIPDDLNRPPIISSDGSGLSSTLFFLQELKKSQHIKANRRKTIPTESFDNVIFLTQQIFSQLQDIKIRKDVHTGKFLASIVVGKNLAVSIPLQSLSDGTLKWLALVCLLITGESLYSIEEPENFLHPSMQKLLVSVIRDTLSEHAHWQYFIVSTHSETFINCCAPSEIILFSYDDNSTSCKRLENAQEILDHLNETGFGLGYYYASNSIQ